MSFTGYEVIRETYEAETSNQVFYSHGIELPAGKVLLGGGAELGDTRGILLSSAPFLQNGDPTAWVASAINSDPSGGPIWLNVFLICADA